MATKQISYHISGICNHKKLMMEYQWMYIYCYHGTDSNHYYRDLCHGDKNQTEKLCKVGKSERICGKGRPFLINITDIDEGLKNQIVKFSEFANLYWK